jgi:hypothetical protein
VWPPAYFVASLGIVRHLRFKARIKVLNCPGHGTSFGKKFSKGTFKARNLQSKFFSQFLVFRIGLRKMHAELGVFTRDGRPYCCAHSSAALNPRFVIPSGLIARNLLSIFAGSSPLPASDSRCGNHLEILWEAHVDGISAARYVCKVSRTVGFALVARSPGLNSPRSGGTVIRSLTTRLNVPVVRNGFEH